MNPSIELLHYIDARKRFYEQLEASRSRLDGLLTELLERAPTLSDLASLEGLHLEKRALFTSFAETEERFVTLLLSRRPGRTVSDEVT